MHMGSQPASENCIYDDAFPDSLIYDNVVINKKYITITQ